MNDLGIYIHVPFCKHLCPYCDFFKIALRDRPASERLEFPNLVARELTNHLERERELSSRTLSTIYFGGGTPSTLNPKGVASLIHDIQNKMSTSSTLEITLEANPENLTSGRCVQWKNAGIDRLSIGVQSFEQKELDKLERLHESSLVADCYQRARDAGFENISLDLMFALPDQTMKTWERNLEQAVTLAPDHISFYGLTYHEETPYFDQLRKGNLSELDDDLQAEMYLFGSRFLREKGYEHYEISNFAKPGFRSRHNQRYWQRKDVLGLGPGAHSNIQNQRWAAPEDIDRWKSCVNASNLPWTQNSTISEETSEGEKLFTLIRRSEGISRNDSPRLYQALETYIDSLGEDVKDDWYIKTEEKISLTPVGWLISDYIVRHVVHLLEAENDTL